MGFFKRLWGYIKALFRSKTEAMMDPEIEIEQAIIEARKRDQELRTQAARVVAHRTQLESQIERAADQSGEARELAKQALLKAQAATAAGDTAAADKWTRAAQGIAMRLPFTLLFTVAFELLKSAVEQKVAFVPGDPFYVNKRGVNTLRLNFSSVDPETIWEGIRRLGEVLKTMLS